jgi:hypothetical protein
MISPLRSRSDLLPMPIAAVIVSISGTWASRTYAWRTQPEKLETSTAWLTGMVCCNGQEYSCSGVTVLTPKPEQNKVQFKYCRANQLNKVKINGLYRRLTQQSQDQRFVQIPTKQLIRLVNSPWRIFPPSSYAALLLQHEISRCPPRH